MYKISFLALAVLLFTWACTPKQGEQMSAAPSAASKGNAPVIPIPSGNIRAAAPQAGTAPKIQIGKAETFKLDNGLTVIVVENHKLPKVSFEIFVDADPVLEKDAVGYVDMMGDLLGKGTKTRTKAQIDEQVDFIGARLSTSDSGVDGQCLSKHTDRLLEIMSDVLLNPTFPQEELDKSRLRLQSALQAQKTDADAIARNVARVLRYGKGHPYGEVTTEESLGKITRDQLVNHYNTFFKPNISYLVVVGDISRDKVEKLAQKYFGQWKAGEAPKFDHGLPRAPEKTQVDFVHKPGAVQSVVSVTYPVELRPGEPDVIRGRLMNMAFGGYFNSRLNSNLREGHGWTYGSFSGLSPDKLIGSFSAGASVRNMVTDSALVEILREMEKIRTEKIPGAELEVVKSVMTGTFAQSLEEPGTAASFALNTARYKLPADYYEKYIETLQAVSPEEALMMAKKFVRPDRAHILVVGNKDEVADKLKKFAPDGKVNFYDIYGNPISYNQIAVPGGVTAQTVIDDYVRAIGGAEKLAALKDLQLTSTMKTRGPEFVIKTWQKGGMKIATEMSMNGQVMSKSAYDGVTATEAAMGAQRTLEGEDLADIQERALISKEALYAARGYQLVLKGAEEIEGKKVYVLEVTRPDGKKSTDYYDMSTGLKIREVSTQPGQDGNPTTVVTDFSDYKEVGGVLMPHTVTLTGVFPVPMKAIVTEAKANAGLDDSIFTIK